MHNIPNAYPSLPPSEYMTNEIERSPTRSEEQLLKVLSRKNEASILIKDMSKESKKDQRSVIRLLKPLDYTSTI